MRYLTCSTRWQSLHASFTSIRSGTLVGPTGMDYRHYRLSSSDRLTGLRLSVDLLFRFIAKRDLTRPIDVRVPRAPPPPSWTVVSKPQTFHRKNTRWNVTDKAADLRTGARRGFRERDVNSLLAMSSISSRFFFRAPQTGTCLPRKFIGDRPSDVKVIVSVFFLTEG